MIIRKFQGKTEVEAITKARDEMGNDAIVMNIKTIKPAGIFRIFKGITVEITAALDEKELAEPGINMVANEKIELQAVQPMIEKPILNSSILVESVKVDTEKSVGDANGLEERLDNLQTLLEQRLNNEKEESDKPIEKEKLPIVKIIYNTMLDNEVHEKFANQVLDDLEKITKNNTNIDFVLANIYQKLVLKFGQPKQIELDGKKPKIVCFVGPTGVGKTTTIAKIASKFKVEYGKKVALLTADTYRIAATEQLKTYANILESSFHILYSPEDVMETLEKIKDHDLILIDTAGFSHRNEAHKEDIKQLLEAIQGNYEKETYLVISATTKYRDLVDIVDQYRTISDYKIIFTKLDETTAYGNILNIKLHTGADLSYSTNGQNVPDDIEVLNTQKLVKQLLGGK